MRPTKEERNLPAAAKLEQLAREVGADWTGAPYYELAEQEGWLETFWAEETPFRRLFRKLDLTSVVDLACGHGRHSEKLRGLAQSVVLMDIDTANIEFCRERFKDAPEFRCVLNNGYTFDSMGDESCTAIFSYDAMVHFDSDVVRSYLEDAQRILVPGGLALFHHSNYTGSPGGNVQDSPYWRNYMSESLFHHYAAKAGLRRIAAEVMQWVDYPAHDCLTLLEKPR